MKTDDQHLATRRAEPRRSIPNSLLSATSGSSKKTDDPRIIAAVEEYLRQCEAGLRPDVEAFVAERPEIAGMLRQCLAGLEFVQAAVPEIEASAAGIDQLGLSESLSGQALGDYRIVREVGRGGMGIVYEAEQISLRRRVALKVLPFAAMLDPRHLQRFKNEALAAASLDHPNIVEVYGVGCERGVHFYAMRYVEGQTLAAVIEGLRGEGRGSSRSSRLAPRDEALVAGLPNSAELTTDHRSLTTPPADTAIAALSTLRTTRPKDFFRRVAELGIQAAEALDHAHQMGIVHRDIKPSNLMIERSHLAPHCSHLAPRDGATPLPSRGEAGRGVKNPLNSELRTPHSEFPSLQPLASSLRLWITDFGLARVQNEPGMTMTGDLLGTLRYMSPEQAEGKSAILDHRTDIYSLGITLYELLALQPAFPATDRQALLRQIVQDEPTAPRKLNKHIPADLETILLKSIAKDPRDRYASAAEMAADLARYVEQKPIAAHPPTRAQRLVKWSRRHSGSVLALAAVLLVLATASAISTVLINRAYRGQEQALERESLERHRTEISLEKSLDIIDRLATRVSEEELLKRPQMEELRLSLLMDALAAQRDVLKFAPETSSARFEVAKTHIRIGNLLNLLNRIDASRPHLRSAIDLLTPLADGSTDDPQFAVELSNAQQALGHSFKAPEEHALKVQALAEGVWVLEEVISQNPHSKPVCIALAVALLNQGATLERTDPTAAQIAYRRATEMYSAVLRITPQDFDALYGVALCHNNLAGIYLSLGDIRQAEASAVAATDGLKAASLSQPAKSEIRLNLGKLYANRAMLYRQQERLPEALSQITLAVDVFAELARHSPAIVDYEQWHGRCLKDQSAIRARLAKNQE